jgi:hypothetical protein
MAKALVRRKMSSACPFALLKLFFEVVSFSFFFVFTGAVMFCHGLIFLNAKNDRPGDFF